MSRLQGRCPSLRRAHHGRADVGADGDGGEHLFESSAAQGARQSIVYLTHKMNEFFEIADEVSYFAMASTSTRRNPPRSRATSSFT